MRIHELDEEESVDAFRRRRGGSPIDHLVLEDVASLPRTLATASESLGVASVHMVHFCVSPKSTIATVPNEFASNGYRVFASQDGSFLPVDTTKTLVPGCYVAMHERGAKASDLSPREGP